MPETVVHFQIRMPPALHERLASRAREQKASLNALIVGILEQAVQQSHDDSTNHPPNDTTSPSRVKLKSPNPSSTPTD
ncbi:toxin-antitoxin system HicB family antitoxin [Isosphaera pallida]|uniref:toxin-antitoxin system HicB family antitoxin n=1 Tax=Isosphaera pallida TaxID=128 RepID=UPI000314FC08|nr:toxin-antitoxin system HicB family antitoxin [Isosphaera pallida]